jgi:hypothetical protein
MTTISTLARTDFDFQAAAAADHAAQAVLAVSRTSAQIRRLEKERAENERLAIIAAREEAILAVVRARKTV